MGAGRRLAAGLARCLIRVEWNGQEEFYGQNNDASSLVSDARTIRDIGYLHALAYVWEASKLFLGKTTTFAKRVPRTRLLRILRGEVTRRD